MRKSTLAAGISAFALAATLLSVPAHAHDRTREPEVVAGGLIGPLTLAVGDRGDVYVTQSFAGLLSKVDKRGQVTNLHQLEVTPPDAGELIGVAYDRGTTYHIESDFSGEVPTSHIVKTTKHGERTVVSEDLWAYEMRRNPDSRQTYGFRNLRRSCVDEVTELEEALGAHLNEYKGIVESHAYQLEVDGRYIYVADAAANAVLRVDSRTGRISTVAVLPSTTITFTADIEAYLEASLPPGVEIPDCVVGKRFTVEPVPTDVAVDRDGRFLVSTLGGLAGEATPLSKIYSINPRSGRSTEVVGDLFGATGLDVGPRGTIVVAEMFGGEVSIVRPHHKRPSVETLFAADAPADVAFADHTVYATTGTFGEGALVKYSYRGR